MKLIKLNNTKRCVIWQNCLLPWEGKLLTSPFNGLTGSTFLPDLRSLLYWQNTHEYQPEHLGWGCSFCNLWNYYKAQRIKFNKLLHSEVSKNMFFFTLLVLYSKSNPHSQFLKLSHLFVPRISEEKMGGMCHTPHRFPGEETGGPQGSSLADNSKIPLSGCNKQVVTGTTEYSSLKETLYTNPGKHSHDCTRLLWYQKQKNENTL